jgi:hypothetical protein
MSKKKESTRNLEHLIVEELKRKYSPIKSRVKLQEEKVKKYDDLTNQHLREYNKIKENLVQKIREQKIADSNKYKELEQQINRMGETMDKHMRAARKNIEELGKANAELELLEESIVKTPNLYIAPKPPTSKPRRKTGGKRKSRKRKSRKRKFRKRKTYKIAEFIY